MSKKSLSSSELAKLDALAKSLVAGRPITATVTFDETSNYLTVELRSTDDPSARRQARPWARTYEATTVTINEQKVRQLVGEFLKKTGM